MVCTRPNATYSQNLQVPTWIKPWDDNSLPFNQQSSSLLSRPIPGPPTAVDIVAFRAPRWTHRLIAPSRIITHIFHLRRGAHRHRQVIICLRRMQLMHVVPCRRLLSHAIPSQYVVESGEIAGPKIAGALLVLWSLIIPVCSAPSGPRPLALPLLSLQPCQNFNLFATSTSHYPIASAIFTSF